MSVDKNIRVLVVCGGISTEREVSLRSGMAIFTALKSRNYRNAELFDLTADNMGEILEKRPDIVFLGLHGKGGEDGTIQGMLDLAGIPYTGPGVACSAVCMNKIFTKRVLRDAGLPTSPFHVMRRDECFDIEQVTNVLREKVGFPMVLKSPCQGSSIGVVIVHKEEDIPAALEEVFRYGDHLLAEQFLDGTEVTLPVLGNDEPMALPIIEITSEREFYDYTAKYTSGLCHHILPARISEGDARTVAEIGRRAYRVLECRGLSRVDFIIDRERGPMIIEVNTLPGMTDMSLFPDAARAVGMSYEDLVEKILEYGLKAPGDLD
ncbi:MAG: D-alanine--D-alanine ligase [Bacteroidales bacterium]|nr:D-alanine--D-alanine ligase [Bacteroidales bacterium]MBR5055755.1 D-alanine--D-alanine ligase [Bacteroidales bacterium]